MQRAAGLHDCLLDISRHGAIEIAVVCVEVLQVAQIAQPMESFRSRYPNRIQYSHTVLRRLALLMVLSKHKNRLADGFTRRDRAGTLPHNGEARSDAQMLFQKASGGQ